MTDRICACFECMANMPEPTDEEIIQSLQAKLDEQAKEIEALREFARAIIDGDLEYSNIYSLPKLFRLIDENGNPTPLLTGEK